MGFFEYATGVKFRKTGSEIKAAIETRLAELSRRLEKRDRELDQILNNRELMRSYLIREPINDYPHPGQMRAEMPTEDHQRITELCRRIMAIEKEVAELSVVRDNLKNDQDCE